MEPETGADERRSDREKFIRAFIAKLETTIQTAGIKGEVKGRPKHIYSIWKKMQRKGLDFHELFDVRAVRVLVEDVPSCYSVLGLVHTLWQPIPGEFADYITTPKGEIAGKVLLVDDLADSGHTLNAVITLLKGSYQPITELRSAVIWTKGVSTFTPDYSVDYLPSNPWIHQPFEAYDSMSPEKLLEKWQI